MKYISKISFIVFLAIIITYTFITPSLATENAELNIAEKSESFKQWEELPENEKEQAIQPSYLELSLKDSVKKSKLNNLLADNNVLDAKYDLRRELENNNIKIKNQGATGSCWAFSYTSMIEAMMIHKYGKSNIEYSPMHVDYMASEIFNRKVGSGGGYGLSLPYGASGYGPVNESDFPFNSVYDEVNNDSSTYYLSNIDKETLKQTPKVNVKDATIFANIFKIYDSNNKTITYKDSNSLTGGNTYTEEQVKAIRNLIKTHIKEEGAVSATFYADSISGITADGNYNSIFYNNDNEAYCKTSYSVANHAVTIVGWDDNFSRDNFNADYKPVNNGAYIVLNSWGERFGDSGYFYVSYDDASIEQIIYGINTLDDKFEYDKLYEYDPLGSNNAINFNDKNTGKPIDTVYSANVYKSEKIDNKYEYLSEIGLFIDTTEGVEIYVNPDNDNINSAFLVASYTGSNALETGYHTIKLPAPLQIKGEKFVVLAKYINTGGEATIPIECNLVDTGLTAEGNDIYNTAKSNPGESFVSSDGTTWKDLYNYSFENYIVKNTNVCIKAMTSYTDELLTVPVTSVELDKTSLTMEVGDKVTLACTINPIYATNKNVKWTSSDENVATVNNGIVTANKEGTAIITVTTEDGNKTATSKITVNKKTNNTDDIYKDESDTKAGQTISEKLGTNLIKGTDNTVANTVIPYTGTATIIIIIGISIIAIIVGIKLKSLKDIK